MDKSLIAASTIRIQAKPEKIWEVLTNPEQIKKYLFGTQVTTDWKVGSPIKFSGDYQGHQYTDKGNVLENNPHTLLKYNYWSGFSGLEDTIENYSLVSYRITAIDDNTSDFEWHQQGFASEDGKCHTEEALKHMLAQIKELAEH